MVVRAGGGRRRFLRQGDRGDRGKLKIDGDGQHSGERRTPCSERRGRRYIFGMLGRRQGMLGWVDDPVQGQTGRTEMV